MPATLTLDTHFHVGPIDPRIFSGFLEHMGRCTYEGAFDPGSPRADAQGFRTDVIEALRPLRMPLIRYPGGNFVSTYNWRDGVGPRESRPARPDFGWKSIEPNTFGAHEFVRWCERIAAKPMMAVNMGTAGPREAGEFVEYCNLPGGTSLSDLRRSNGSAEPFAIKTWCLGNEMDGPWQAGHGPAADYAVRAEQAAKIMKGIDPTIQVIAAGSSAPGMPQYMQWDRTVLEYGWEQFDYVSAHRFSREHTGDSAWFLAEGVLIDRHIEDYAALFNYVRALKRSTKRVYLSYDEYNIWYRNNVMDGKWTKAPHLLEEEYNLEDALVFAQYLMSFIRHADVVKIAAPAQLLNVLGLLQTRRDVLLLQSIYHAFAMLSQRMSGVSLVPVVDGHLYSAGTRGDVPVLDAAAGFDDATGETRVALVHRGLGRAPLQVVLKLDDRMATRVVDVALLTHKDVKAGNTWEAPKVVRPIRGEARIVDGKVEMELPAASLAVVTMVTEPR